MMRLQKTNSSIAIAEDIFVLQTPVTQALYIIVNRVNPN